MYRSHWGMKVKPFDCSHVPAFFVPVQSATVAMTKVRYGLSSSLGAVSITGEAGVGKTEILRVTMAELQAAGWLVCYIPNPNQPAQELIDSIAKKIGAASGRCEDVISRLEQLAEADVCVCVAVDDVHTVTDLASLEALRMLLNIEKVGRPTINMILAGQPYMNQLLKNASDFASRLGVRVNLNPLSKEECNQYVLYRLKVSGCTRGIFTKISSQMIYKFSKGRPRDINRLCELALMTGYGWGIDKVDPDAVEHSAIDLGLAEDSGDILQHAIAADTDVDGDILAGL